MSKVFLKSVGFTEEELKLLISPIRDADGNLRHESLIVVNPNKIREVIKQLDVPKGTKIKLDAISKKMIDVMNELGFNQYFPDKFKPIFSALIAMAISNDKEFIEVIK